MIDYYTPLAPQGWQCPICGMGLRCCAYRHDEIVKTANTREELEGDCHG